MAFLLCVSSMLRMVIAHAETVKERPPRPIYIGGGSRGHFWQEGCSCGLRPGRRAGVSHLSLHPFSCTPSCRTGRSGRRTGGLPAGWLLVGGLVRPRLPFHLCRAPPWPGLQEAFGAPADVFHRPVSHAESALPRSLALLLAAPAGPR